MIQYHIQVMIGGREGTQEEHEGSKREAIRKCKRLVSSGGVGSYGSVTMRERGINPTTKTKGTLIFQCYRAKTRSGKLVTKVDEL